MRIPCPALGHHFRTRPEGATCYGAAASYTSRSLRRRPQPCVGTLDTSDEIIQHSGAPPSVVDASGRRVGCGDGYRCGSIDRLPSPLAPTKRTEWIRGSLHHNIT